MRGGAEGYVSKISRELSRSHDVIVITTSPEARNTVEKQAGIKVYRINPFNLYNTYYSGEKSDLVKPLWHGIDMWNPHALLLVRRIMALEQPDVVNTHNLGGISLAAFSTIRSLCIPHVHTLHDFSLLCPRANFYRGSQKICPRPRVPCRIYEYVKKQLVGSPPVVIAPSDFILRVHHERGFFTSSRLVRVPLGIEPPENVSFHTATEKIRFLYVGRLTREKGVLILINAFRDLEYQNISLDIVGDGADSELCRHLTEGDVRMTVHGFLPRKALERIYYMSHVLVVPSVYYDNSPTVIYEAMSHGLLVIGSRIGGIPELIEHGKNGLLFEAGDREGLKNLMEMLIQSPEKIREYSEKAHETSLRFTMENHLKQITSLYRELVTKA